MALVKLGGLITAASGASAGVTFKQTRSGTVMAKTQRTPATRRPLQIQQQARFARASRAWSQLTALQRLAWSTAARNFPIVNRLGVVTHPTGPQFFILCNEPAWTWGEAIKTTPPLPVPRDPALTFASSFAEGGPYDVWWGAPSTSFQGFALISCARPFTTVVPRHFRGYRLLKKAPLAGTEVSVTAEFIAALGAMVHGEAYGVRAMAYDSQNRPIGCFFTAGTVIG